MTAEAQPTATDFWPFVVELASNPAAVKTLLRTHVADATGKCKACGRPGYGTPEVNWPCGPAGLALLAGDVGNRKLTNPTASTERRPR